MSDRALESAQASEPSSDSDESDSEGWTALGDEETHSDQDTELINHHQSALRETGEGSTSTMITPNGLIRMNGENTWEARFEESGINYHVETLNLQSNGILGTATGHGYVSLDILDAVGGGILEEAGEEALAPTNSDFELSSEQLHAVKNLMAGISLDYTPPWAGEVSEEQWRRKLHDRLEGRRQGPNQDVSAA